MSAANTKAQCKSTSAWKYFKQQLKNMKNPKQPRSGNSPFPCGGDVTGVVGVPQSAFSIFTLTPAPGLSPHLCKVDLLMRCLAQERPLPSPGPMEVTRECLQTHFPCVSPTQA